MRIALRLLGFAQGVFALFPSRRRDFSNPFRSGPVVANGVLYATSGNGACPVAARDYTPGTPPEPADAHQAHPRCAVRSSHTRARAAVFGDPAVASGMVYFADGDGFHFREAVIALICPENTPTRWAAGPLLK